MSNDHPLPGDGYWYLAGPYTDNIHEHYKEHLKATAFLTKAQLTIYSPIVHYHNVAQIYDMPTDSHFWGEHNLNMIRPSNGIILLQLPNWENSIGVKGELLFCRMKGLPIWSIRPPTEMTFLWTRMS